MPYYTEAEQIAWLNSQPSKRIAAKAVIENSAGQLLIVKPNYKDGWQFVGGIVEENESPALAMQRETEEEIGILLPFERFRFVAPIYLPAKGAKNDLVYFIFHAVLTPQEEQTIQIPKDELDAYEFVAQGTITERLQNPTDAIVRLWEQNLTHGYLEKGGLLIPGRD